MQNVIRYMASFWVISPLLLKSEVTFAPIGYPNKKPVITAYVPYFEILNILFIIGKINSVKYGIIFKAMIIFDIMINGKRLGMITLNHNRRPYLAPSILWVGNMRIKLKNIRVNNP